jgi:hypothetical protein
MTTLVRRVRLARVMYAAALALAVGSSATSARADTMDPTPERFVIQPTLPKGFNGTCQSIAANPAIVLKAPFPKGAVPNNYACLPDNLAFQNLVSELGFAIAPTAFHPARTTGFGGFNFSFEASYTKINQDAYTQPTNGQPAVQYWHLGTQGSQNPNNGNGSSVNTSPDSVIQVYSLKARKGLPLGFEITGDLSYIADSVMWTAGADVRWALMEGFRTGWPSFLPDVSVGGGVRTLTGTSKFSLTTVGIDAQISKPITLADSAVLTPYLGYQRLYMFGDSSTVDLTPNTDPLKQCYQNQNSKANPVLPDGQPNCGNIPGSSVANNGDFNNDVTFQSVRTDRHRGIVGINYRYEILYLAGQFLFDLTPPNAENPGLSTTRQWTTSLEAGVYF